MLFPIRYRRDFAVSGTGSAKLEPCRYMPDIVSAELMSYGYDYRRRYLHSLHNNVKNFKKPRDLIHLTGISLEPKLLRTSQLLNGHCRQSTLTHRLRF